MKINDKFWISMISSFLNCPWFLNLTKKWLRNQRFDTIFFQWKWRDVMFWTVIKCVKLQITQPKLHQINDIGGVLESSGRADSKTVIGIPIWPRFDRENKETSWHISNDQLPADTALVWPPGENESGCLEHNCSVRTI